MTEYTGKEIKNLIEIKRCETELLIELIKVLQEFDEKERLDCVTLFEVNNNKYYAREILDYILKKYF